MANSLYLSAKENILGGNIDLANDTLYALLVDTDVYEPSINDDENETDIPLDAVIASATLINKSIADGIFDADDLVFTGIPTGSNIGGIVLVKHTNSPSSSLLICFIDNQLTTDGSDLTIQWSEDEYKIFAI